MGVCGYANVLFTPLRGLMQWTVIGEEETGLCVGVECSHTLITLPEFTTVVSPVVPALIVAGSLNRSIKINAQHNVRKRAI